jgi:hypothetical protein
MSNNVRPSPALSASQVGDAPGSSLVRPAALPVLLVIFVALAAATLAWVQLRTVEQDHLPALRDAQQLETTASVTSVALRSADFARADSLAQRFHAVAGSVRNSETKQFEMRSYDASFVDYYVSARRVAEGTSMSEEADLSSSESARLAKGILTERLDNGMAADGKAVDATPVATLKLRIVVSLLFAISGSVVLLLLAPRRRPATLPVADLPRAVVNDRRHEDHSHLQEAVRRMATRRQAVALAAAEVAERNRQQVALLEAQPSAPTLTVIRSQSQVSRTPANTSFQFGKRALAGV